MRKINEMFHVDDEGFLVKTSNGERVLLDEPVFILRGRDRLAVVALNSYVNEMGECGCDWERINAVGKVIQEFYKFAMLNPDRMKFPGVTKGK